MKTGEGYHDFGWGTYFTENRGVVKFYRSTLPRFDQSDPGTYIMKADLPDQSNLIFWDGDLSKQSAKVKNAIMKLSKQHDIPIGGFPGDGFRTISGTSGHFYRSLGKVLGSDKKASLAFDSLGIPGLRYLDAGSRGVSVGNRTFNYVIWDPDQIKVMYRHKKHLS